MIFSYMHIIYFDGIHPSYRALYSFILLFLPNSNLSSTFISSPLYSRYLGKDMILVFLSLAYFI